MTIKIILVVVTAGCVVSQSTIDDSESPSVMQLKLQLNKLEHQHEMIAQMLSRLLDGQQQLQAISTNRPHANMTGDCIVSLT